ncbi:hypothetical protein ACFQ3Z_02230 [Streptomyces nogalater]
MASSSREVVDAVQQAVDEGRRIAVRSGGHCFENFVDDPSVKALVDLSPCPPSPTTHGGGLSRWSRVPCSVRSTGGCSSAGA